MKDEEENDKWVARRKEGNRLFGGKKMKKNGEVRFLGVKNKQRLE